jgi:hypothetical protein
VASVKGRKIRIWIAVESLGTLDYDLPHKKLSKSYLAAWAAAVQNTHRFIFFSVDLIAGCGLKI